MQEPQVALQQLLVLVAVLVSLLDQVLDPLVHKVGAPEQKLVQGRGRDVPAAQVHRAVHPVPDPPQAAHPPSPQQQPTIVVHPTADTDTFSIVRGRGNKIRFGIGTSCGSSQR